MEDLLHLNTSAVVTLDSTSTLADRTYPAMVVNGTFESMDNRTLTTIAVNDSTLATDVVIEPPMYIVVTSTLLYIIIFVVGVLGNGLVIVVILCGRSMRTSVNMYLTNLCLADILVILVCMPTALADIFTKDIWYFGGFMCKFVPFVENAVANASILTILAISWERYRVVCHPLKGIEESSVKIWRVMIGVWVMSITSCIPWISIPQFRQSIFYDGTPIQVCRNPIVEDWQRGYVIILTVVFFVVPSVILFVLNCHLCRLLHITRPYEACIHENKLERKRRQNQVANIIASIVTLFFVCHLPYRVAVLWFTFEDKDVIWSLGLERYLAILYSVRIMFYMNHALNPVIYNFMSTKFRSAMYETYRSIRRFGLCYFCVQYRRRNSSIMLSTKSAMSRQRQSSSEV